MFTSWLFFLFCAYSWNYKHCPDDLDANIPQACFNSVRETGDLSNSLLSQDRYDLRVVTFNTFDWNAGRNGHDRIRQWLQSVLPTVDVIAFQEFGYNRLDRFVRSFGMTRVRSDGGNDKMIYIRNNLISEYADHVTYTRRDGIGMDHCNCGVRGYHRGVDVARIRVGGRQVYLANNHGCVGGCGGSRTAFGGSEIIKVLNEQGFFTNDGAHSIFLGDVNYWNAGGIIYSNDPKGLCAPQLDGSIVGRMSVRGKLQCGAGHDLDFVAYGRGFHAVKHYSFSGAGNFNGDSDHKAVMIDLVFTENYDPSQLPPPSVDSRVVVNFVGRNACASTPCSDGQSDCDSDDECEGDLICWQRSNGETDPRYDTSGVDGTADVCVQPTGSVPDDSTPDNSAPQNDSPIIVVFVGKDTCGSVACSDGQSDCDNDNECEGDLICWQRNNGETDSRYDTSRIPSNADVCIRSTNIETTDAPNPLAETDDPNPIPETEAPIIDAECANEQFRVATYNILYKTCPGYHDSCNCASSGPANYAANSVRPDIMGTQENGCQVDFGNDMGEPYEVVPYTCQSCNHNAIYYNSDTIQYAGVQGVESIVRDNYSDRMFSYARMRTAGGFVFWLFNVHNPHEHGNSRGYQGRIAEQMITKWKEVGNGQPAVFTGDFNPHKDSNNWEHYALEHGLVKVGQSSGGICGFCDQIYFSEGDFEVVSTKAHGSGGSDHNAYSAVLKPVCNGQDPQTSEPTSPATIDVSSAPTDPDTMEIRGLTDEFSGSSVDESKWDIMHFDASWKNNEKECYVPNNVKVENGNLILTATERSFQDSRCGNQQYFSGSIESKTYFLHGSIEVRAKLPSGDGLWPAIWLLGNDKEITWPACGEIDLMEVANKDPVGSKATLHYGPRSGNSINLHFGNTPNVPLKDDFHTWKIIRTSDVIVMLFDGVEFGRKTRSEILATNYPHATTMFDAEMRVIFNVAVGGGFTGIGNRAPDMSTWDKATMEIDYIRTWGDDQTAAPTDCMLTVACGFDTCASCVDRVEWLMANQGKTRDQAEQEVANEFPDECDCGSDCMSKLACDGSSCYTCGARIEWLEANEGMTTTEAKQRVEQEFPVECKCGRRYLHENNFRVEEDTTPNAVSAAAFHLSKFHIIAGISAILFCGALAAFFTLTSHKDEAKEDILDPEANDFVSTEDRSSVVLQEKLEKEML